MNEHFYLGNGVYTVAEAALLTQIPGSRIRRWLKGYQYRAEGSPRQSTPVVVGHYLSAEEDELALSFLDLIEARFIDAFLKYGVGWRTIRIAAKRAAEIMERSHPFSSRQFKTDGKTILATIVREEKDPELLDLALNQMAFQKVLKPFLYNTLDFSDEDIALRWWPEGRKKSVVVDPRRSFGKPIIDRVGIPTRTLADSVKVEGSIERVAMLFEVKRTDVKHAVDFEKKLVA